MVFSLLVIVVAILVYMAASFWIAEATERRAAVGKNWANNPIVYSLAIAGGLCGAWSYYGCVGLVVTQGMFYSAIYISLMLCLMFGKTILSRIIKLKDTYKITSIADFIATRYGKSQAIATIVTAIIVINAVPFIASQLSAVTDTTMLITGIADEHTLLSSSVRPIVAISIILFTIIFGMRRLDPTERHPGMVVAMASEFIIRLAAWLAVGLFVVVILFGGIDGLNISFNEQLSKGFSKAPGFIEKTSIEQVLLWLPSLVLSIAFTSSMPKNFHIVMIENHDKKHISTAMWLVPLQFFLMTIFVIPVALAGVLHCPKGITPDTYLLSLPLQYGQSAMSLLVFVGGFSAATGMIILETVAITTMFSNHLLMPLIESTRYLWFLRRHLLLCRWIAATVLILVSAGFELTLGKSAMLSSFGLIASTILLVFAPIFLIGLLWQRANKVGAILGLIFGIVALFYLMIVPTLAKAGLISQTILVNGPFGLSFLRPTALFGLTGLPFLTNAVLWVLIFTIVPYVLGSLLYLPS
ncbi:MAG: hypothetical protein AB1489_43005, partial [Acidobacteriota bacterium]